MTVWLWIGFVCFVLTMLAIDLGVINRKSREIRFREAITWTSICVATALIFNVFVYFMYERQWFGASTMPGHETGGTQAALKFFTGYLVEMSLSLDNVFVIAMVFLRFGVRRELQHRVLFWGILGALVLRGAMIAAGVTLIHRFDWMIYVFGVLLIYTAVKMAVAPNEEFDPEKSRLVRWARRLYPISDRFEGERFFIRVNGRLTMTPLFLCLLVIEFMDVIFAIDSIPAILAITVDSFIVFTSNVFAIICLRSLYFALAAMISRFHYLDTSLIFLLGFIGVKMLISHHVEIPVGVSLAVVVVILAAGMLASLLLPARGKKAALLESEASTPEATPSAMPEE